jgi:hypothetical protein
VTITRTGKPRRMVMGVMGRLNVERAPHDLFADLTEALRCALSDRLREIVLAVTGARFGASA